MLRLCRLRFDAIGAPDVRLAPLELDFTSDGEASDTLLWMRNGGGKTAILSLFFALLRPDRREFLGALTEAVQIWVPFREGCGADLLADVLGACAYAAWHGIRRTRTGNTT